MLLKHISRLGVPKQLICSVFPNRIAFKPSMSVSSALAPKQVTWAADCAKWLSDAFGLTVKGQPAERIVADEGRIWSTMSGSSFARAVAKWVGAGDSGAVVSAVEAKELAIMHLEARGLILHTPPPQQEGVGPFLYQDTDLWRERRWITTGWSYADVVSPRFLQGTVDVSHAPAGCGCGRSIVEARGAVSICSHTYCWPHRY